MACNSDGGRRNGERPAEGEFIARIEKFSRRSRFSRLAGGILIGLGRNRIHLQNPAANIQVPLWERNLDPGFAQFAVNGEVEIAAIGLWPVAHLIAPGNEFKI